MTDTPILPDWVLREAAKQCEWGDTLTIPYLQRCYGDTKFFRVICDLILKHEQPPVDRKLLCAEEACIKDGWHITVKTCVRAIELYESGFGK